MHDMCVIKYIKWALLPEIVCLGQSYTAPFCKNIWPQNAVIEQSESSIPEIHVKAGRCRLLADIKKS